MVGRLIPAILASLMLLSACDGTVEQVQLLEELPAPKETYDLNSVTLGNLYAIPELHSDTAQNIIAFQQKFGFRRVEDLLNVEGVGEATFLKIRRYFYIAKK